MPATSKLALQLLQNGAANQTLGNETFAQLNQLVQAGVVDRTNTPPGSPADEALYIITATATGVWTGKENQLAYWLTSTGAWQYITPREGMLVHVNDEDLFYKYTGSAWVVFTTAFPGGTLSSALNEAPIAALASAATVNIGAAAANTISISGTTTIIAFDVIPAGAVRRLVFQGALILTHHATAQILPTGANITTAAGDVADFVSLGSGNWRCVHYLRASGDALAFAYKRDNVLGTVSQSGGVPTGALMEYGSNANGEYWRYANGQQICSILFTVTAYQIATAYLGGFRGSGTTWTFPAAFVATPRFEAVADNLSGFGCGTASGSSVGVAVFWFAVASQAAADRQASVIAVGRWF